MRIRSYELEHLNFQRKNENEVEMLKALTGEFLVRKEQNIALHMQGGILKDNIKNLTLPFKVKNEGKSGLVDD